MLVIEKKLESGESRKAKTGSKQYDFQLLIFGSWKQLKPEFPSCSLCRQCLMWVPKEMTILTEMFRNIIHSDFDSFTQDAIKELNTYY